MRGVPMLEVGIARKAFGAGREVLGTVAFSVAPGEVVALLGPSGTGKSTVLRILLGLDKKFDGFTRLRATRVGVMFQEPRLLPWLTVAENLRLVVTAAMRMPDIAALLASVQLGDAAALYPRQLSLGMARRAALARALAVSPDLLVLDEPFASLDPQLGAVLADVVATWARETGAAVLLATHDLGQALERASRVLVLAGGPAVLAADVAVPAEDGPARAALRHDLIGIFDFLRGAGEGKPDIERLPSAPPLA